MTTIALIPARGGSKGLPKKNIKTINGKPLISWSIEQALLSKRIDKVFVSTDCNEIADIARESGAIVPFLRPKNLATDESTTESAINHFLKYLDSHGNLPERLILLQCTSPIRYEQTLDKAIEYFDEHNLDSLLSVRDFHGFIWEDINNPSANYDFKKRPRRQDIKSKKYLETGSFYITKSKSFLEFQNRLVKKIGMFVTSDEESYEIDTELDFLICESIMKKTL